jgi:hypothetical protein
MPDLPSPAPTGTPHPVPVAKSDFVTGQQQQQHHQQQSGPSSWNAGWAQQQAHQRAAAAATSEAFRNQGEEFGYETHRPDFSNTISQQQYSGQPQQYGQHGQTQFIPQHGPNPYAGFNPYAGEGPNPAFPPIRPEYNPYDLENPRRWYTNRPQDEQGLSDRAFPPVSGEEALQRLEGAVTQQQGLLQSVASGIQQLVSVFTPQAQVNLAQQAGTPALPKASPITGSPPGHVPLAGVATPFVAAVGQQPPKEHYPKEGPKPVVQPKDDWLAWLRSVEEWTTSNKNATPFELGRLIKASLGSKDQQRITDGIPVVDDINHFRVIEILKEHYGTTAAEDKTSIVAEWDEFKRKTSDYKEYILQFENHIQKLQAKGLTFSEDMRTEFLLTKCDLSKDTLKSIQGNLTTVLQAKVHSQGAGATLGYLETRQQITALQAKSSTKVMRTTTTNSKRDEYNISDYTTWSDNSGQEWRPSTRGYSAEYNMYYNTYGRDNKHGKGSRKRSRSRGYYDQYNDFPPGKDNSQYYKGSGKRGSRSRSPSKGKGKGKKGKRSPSRGSNRSNSPRGRECKFGIECYDTRCWRQHPAGWQPPADHQPASPRSRSYHGRSPSRSQSPHFGGKGKRKH